jgi:competence protein ComEC
LDVGQGQALFWHEAGQTTLIDAAGRGYGRWDPGARIVRPVLLERGVRRLDRLILSHGHADHAAGAFAIIDAFEIGELWLGPGWWRDRRLADLAAHARRRGAATRLVSRGDRAPGVRILGPSRENPLSDNAASLVVALGTAPWSLFVPGDLDGAPLHRLLSENRPAKAGAVVLAHHGSREGTPAALLNAVRPDSALVSCGWNNRFGHPHREIVERLDRRDVSLWRTDHHGTIELTAGPHGWRVATERGLNPGGVPGAK